MLLIKNIYIKVNASSKMNPSFSVYIVYKWLPGHKKQSHFISIP